MGPFPTRPVPDAPAQRGGESVGGRLHVPRSSRGSAGAGRNIVSYAISNCSCQLSRSNLAPARLDCGRRDGSICGKWNTGKDWQTAQAAKIAAPLGITLAWINMRTDV